MRQNQVCRAIGGTLTAAGLMLACTNYVEPDLLSGDVNGDLLTPGASARMQLQSNQTFVPGEQTNPEVMPAYPADLLPLRLSDQEMCVSFVVNRDGSVSSVRPLYGAVECPASADLVRPEFVQTALEAVSRWDFLPFQRCTFPPGTPSEQQCNGPGATVEQVEVTLGYRFLFSARNGAGVVQGSSQ